MEEYKNIIDTKFGQLKMSDGPENLYCWTGIVKVPVRNNFEEIPVFILTNGLKISDLTIEFVSSIVLDASNYIKASIKYIQEILIHQSEEYKISKDEFDLLLYDIDLFPLFLPEFTFWEGSQEWMIRFAEGQFRICDPLGIGITFKRNNPISVNNLEESEFID